MINVYNHGSNFQVTVQEVTQSFVGQRPLIKNINNPIKISDECAIQAQPNCTTVFAGKWKTVGLLAKKQAEQVV